MKDGKLANIPQAISMTENLTKKENVWKLEEDNLKKKTEKKRANLAFFFSFFFFTPLQEVKKQKTIKKLTFCTIACTLYLTKLILLLNES